MAESLKYVLTDIDVPFRRMVVILVKWAIAAIPAIVLLGLVLLGLWIAVLYVIMWQMPPMPIAP
jgi:hypothetical protein